MVQAQVTDTSTRSGEVHYLLGCAKGEVATFILFTNYSTRVQAEAARYHVSRELISWIQGVLVFNFQT